VAVGGGRRRGAARRVGVCRADVATQGERGKNGRRLPYPAVELWRWLSDGGRHRNGGAAAGRSSSGNGGSGARVLSEVPAAAWGTRHGGAAA
jgi:hypothetical protein